MSAVTDLASMPEPDDSSPGRRGPRPLLTAAVLALLLALGIGTWLWWPGGGARRAITELAEEGAVKLVDSVLDEVLGAA